MSILDEMKVRRLYCDGGMGSLLQAAGLAAGELPERWNISHPEVITDVHRKYLAAGADIMTTNTCVVPAITGISGHCYPKHFIRLPLR